MGAGLLPTVYRLGARHRRLWLLLALTLVLLGGALLLWLPLEENIESLLPDGGQRVAQDFRLLQKAPFTRKAVFQVSAAPLVKQTTLIAATDQLRDGLSDRFFDNAVSGPVEQGGGALIGWLGQQIPHLSRVEDLEALATLTASDLQEKMARNVENLVSPQGWWMKGLLRQDPLGLHLQVLKRFRHLNPLPAARIEGNHFISPDGRHTLVLADVKVSMTDSAASEQLLAHVDSLRRELPEGVEVSLLSGHRYTAANARAIQGDLVRVMSVSVLGILTLFLVFLRHWRALFVFAVPCSVVGMAAGGVALVYGTVSGITLGFGAVLLGITVDYALHVYLALRHEGDVPEQILTKVARPVLFGGLTTLGAFAVLLQSDLPGQRQLAIFSMAGIGLGLLLALTVLPQLTGTSQRSLSRSGFRTAEGRRWILLVWFSVVLAALTQVPRVEIDGRLSSLGYVPKDLRDAEQQLKEVWGDVRGKALVFAAGRTLEETLQQNDQVYRTALSVDPEMEIVSLAPLLPSLATQKTNGEDWLTFWQSAPGKALSAAVDQAASDQGFSGKAFAPFDRLRETLPDPIGPETLQKVGMGGLLESLLLSEDEGFRTISLVPDSPELLARLKPLLPEGVRIVSQGQFGVAVGEAIRADFVRFLGLALVVVACAVALLFRRWRPALLALLPVASGLVVMLGVMGALGLPLNLFNIVATVLVIGLGVDYGIFMVCRDEAAPDGVTGRAVLISGLTTLAGFGALVLARHPAMFSIGITVLLGISTAIPSALLVVPALKENR